jgi:hypothetical protein
LKQVRQLAQRFRFLHQLNRWTMHPALEPWLKQHAGQLPGQQLRLPQEHWEGWLNQRFIDQILDCRILNGEIPHQTEIHLALVLDPAPASQNSVFLGDWSSVDGLEDAVRAAGWMIAANQPTSETAGTLKALPAQQAFSASKPTHLVVAEVALHWRYGPLIQQLDPLAETERQQFERLLLTCLCLGTGTATQNNLDVPGLDFSGLPLG